MATPQKIKSSKIFEWRRKHKKKNKQQSESNILSIDSLNVSYGPIKALNNLSIEVPKGKIISILGSNGAGKSTLLKTISGLKDAESGGIAFENKPILGTSPDKLTDMGIIHAPEGRQVFTELSVYENLMIGAFTVKDDYIRRETLIMEALPEKTRKRIETNQDEEWVYLKRDEIITNNIARVYDLFPVLKERKHQIALTLSGGEQQMLAIGRALMGLPKLLLLDEPSLGLAPMIVRNIFDIILKLNQAGITIVIVEQNVFQALKIADYAYVLKVGNVIKEGTAKSLLEDEDLVEAYLGK